MRKQHRNDLIGDLSLVGNRVPCSIHITPKFRQCGLSKNKGSLSFSLSCEVLYCKLTLRWCLISPCLSKERRLQSLWKSPVNPSWIPLKQWLRCINTAQQASPAKSAQSTAVGPHRPLQSTLVFVEFLLTCLEWRVVTVPLFLLSSDLRTDLKCTLKSAMWFWGGWVWRSCRFKCPWYSWGVTLL